MAPKLTSKKLIKIIAQHLQQSQQPSQKYNKNSLKVITQEMQNKLSHKRKFQEEEVTINNKKNKKEYFLVNTMKRASKE